MDAKVVLAAFCFILVGSKSAEGATKDCYQCIGLSDSESCGEKPSSSAGKASCSGDCYQASYKLSGKSYYSRGCLPSSVSDCDKLEDTLNIAAAESYKVGCCSEDLCNAATYSAASKMAAIICISLALFTWWNKF